MAATNENMSSKISETIWGHRFKDGQRGPEYVLEFLNVLWGTDYDLGAYKYKRKKAINFRKFIFEGVKEGANGGIATLCEEEKQKLMEVFNDSKDVNVLKKFLRNLEVPLYNTDGKMADRSWFAKMIYPLHESLLFFELRVKNNTIDFERNFFSRGGELYFLMIYHGTKNNPILKGFIEDRFKELLQKNDVIHKVYQKVADATSDIKEELSYGYLRKHEEMKQGQKLPILPEENLPIYEDFAEELANLLKIDIDIYEMFHLLTSLICFQLLRYMLYRAISIQGKNINFFVDCLEGTDNLIYRLSAKNFATHELIIKKSFDSAFEESIKNNINEYENIDQVLSEWKAEPEIFLKQFNFNKLGQKNKTLIKKALSKCENKDDIFNKLIKELKNIVSDQLKKHQLGINRILVRDGGIGGYRSGSSYRYVYSDTLLQAIVYSNLKPNEEKEFSEFLELLYQKYGIVIGEDQARESNLYEESNLNIRYFQKNEQALREKLRKNGLLIEFSDATAMIQNPFKLMVGVQG